MVTQFIRAARDADEGALETLLAPSIGRVFPRLAAVSRGRAHIVQELLTQGPRRRTLDPDISIDEIIDVAGIVAVPLSQEYSEESLPPGFRGSDLYVSFPLHMPGRQYFGRLGWRLKGAMVVRPGAEPEIIAL
jgi:hypothetical protein